jgi:hypothetical protein
MEYLLIFGLGIFVFVIWRSGQDGMEKLREELRMMEREIGWLREQLTALSRTRLPETPPAPVAARAPTTVKEPERAAPPKSIEPAQATHTAPPAKAAFTAAPAVAPVVTPAVTPPTPPPPPLPPKPEPAKPWAEALSAQPLVSSAPPKPAPAPARPAEFFSPPAPLAPQTEPAKPAIPVAPNHAAETDAAAAKDAARRRQFSIEETLGTNWLNKLGVGILVIGLAFFLAYKLQTWGPGGKVLTGFAVSFALLAGGVWLERKPTYRIFARAGIGGGWALAYFTTFAMHHIPAARVLDSLAADLVLMLLVAAGMVGHSLRYRSQAVTGLAFLLGFGTLLTSDLEAGGGTVVFSLAASAVLALALVVVTTLRHWTVLEMAGAAAVYLNHLVWLTRVLPENHAAFAQFWPSTVLILLYWAIFRAAYVLRKPLTEEEENQSALTAILNSGGVLGLLKFQSAHPEWAFWALAALGAIEMALAFAVRGRRRKAFVVLTTIASVLLIASVPFKFHGVSWPVLWLVEAQALAICGLRLGEPVFRLLGLLAGVVTGGVLAFHDVLPLLLLRLSAPDPDWHLGGHLSLVAALVLAAALYWIHAEVYPKCWPAIAEDEREAFALKITSWLGVATAAAAVWVALPELWLPVGWLALVLALGFASRRFQARLLGIEADMLALSSGLLLALDRVAPLILAKQGGGLAPHRWAETAVLALAALAYWAYAELYPRALWKAEGEPDAWQGLVWPIISWLGLASAAAALWVALPELWLPVGWLALVLALGFLSPRFRAELLGIEADLLALAAGLLLAFDQLFTLIMGRLGGGKAHDRWAETAVLALAALAYWLYAELYPRTLWKTESEPSPWQGLAWPVISWLGLGSAAAALWVALPDRWLGVGWLLLMLALVLLGHRFKASLLADQADALALGSAVALMAQPLFPLINFRLANADPSRHVPETTVLALAALAYWLRGEVFPRLRPASASNGVDASAWKPLMQPLASWLGTAAATGALWAVLPAPWVAVGWLALMLLVGVAADRLKSALLAAQADALALCALAGLLPWDVATTGWWDHKAPLIAVVALLYTGMRRRTPAIGSFGYAAPAYSWFATGLLTLVAADFSANLWLTPVWAGLGLALFELGRLFCKGFLRWQGYLLVGLGLARYLGYDLWASFADRAASGALTGQANRFSLINSLLLELLILAAAGYWLLERTRNPERSTKREHIVGLAADALGTFSIALWFAYRFPSDWVPVPGGEAWVTAIWAGMATILLALAWLLRRRAFLVQAMALVLAAVTRGLVLDLVRIEPAGFWHGTLFHLGATSAILLLALPFAYLLRRTDRFGEDTFHLPPEFNLLLANPQQLFFFAALGFQVVALAVKLSSGHITIAWSLLGLATFLFALIVGERSFRLAGLGLLLVSVAKILAMDVWKLEPSDRYTTLIVLGLALLAVSFLYTRFSAVIRKYL